MMFIKARANRDTMDDPISSMMEEIRIEASLAASSNHTARQVCKCPSRSCRGVAPMTCSHAMQKELPKAVSYTVRSRLEFRCDPKAPTLTKTLLLEESRGVRPTKARALSNRSHNGVGGCSSVRHHDQGRSGH